jgi:hypothetical protein
MENSSPFLEIDQIKAHSKCLISGGYFIVFDDCEGVVITSEDYFTCRIHKHENPEKDKNG